MDPLQALPEAQVFWLAREDTSAIVLAEAPAILSAGAEAQPTIGAAFTASADGETSLLYALGGDQNIQLVDAANTPPDKPLAALVPLGPDG